MTPRVRSIAVAGALLFLVVHLAHLARTLEDIDSINFALGVESFDVADHRPHPPGYPLFVALAKASTAVVGAIRPEWGRDQRAAAGLAVWGAIAGALAVLAVADFWIVAGLGGASALLAALVTVASPLFWFTASRPLTDAPGLVLAVFIQTWLLRGLTAIRKTDASRAWLAATCAAGLAVGFRSQSMWLTGPFIAWGVVVLAGRKRWGLVAATIGAGVAGVALWLVPLLGMTGVSAYWRVLGSQSADDFAGPHMLAVSLTGRRLSTYIGHTFVNPWQLPALAYVVLALALIGVVAAARRNRGVLAAALVGFLPYLVFHLAFQETVTIRYALPMVVPVVGLAVFAITRLGIYAGAAGATAIIVASLIVAEPRLSAYARDGAPAFRAFQDMQRTLPAMSEPPVLRMHHQVWWAVRRVANWYSPVWDTGPQPFPGDREWLSVVDHFRSGSARRVWFLGHLTRTDMAAFDPRTTERTGTYALSPALVELTGGVRVDTFAWWSIAKPGWMLGAGWALTPELAGMAELDRAKGQTGPAEAFIARRPGPMRVMIGGRYLGPDNGPAGRVSVEIDGRQVAEWRVSSNPRWFVQWIDVAGIADGSDPYATLRVRVSAETPGVAAPTVGLEQFDAAPAAESMYALTTGWYEQEENPATGLAWRWMGRTATIDVRGSARDRTLTIAGESPARYFSQPPAITVRAGERELGTYTFTSDFSQKVAVPANSLDTAGQIITIEANRTFKPADLQPGSPDQRDLSLRLYTVRLD